MNSVDSCYTPGIIGTIEQFTLNEEELRRFVIYTYYNKDGQPLYVGRSMAFYDAHYLNLERLQFFSEVEYVGFLFMRNENDIKNAKKYYVKARNPKYNQRKCKKLEFLPEMENLDWEYDDLVVREKEMRQRWSEFLG